LYVNGVDVNWRRFDEDYKHQRQLVALPSYPFQRKRYWIDETESRPSLPGRSQRRDGTKGHPLLGVRFRSALPQIVFESRLSSDSPVFLNDHQVYGVAVMPASSYLEMALAAATEVFGPGAKAIEDIVIHEAMVLSKEQERTVQLILQPEEKLTSSFQ